MLILFKKGGIKDTKNYIPICLLSNMYKLFTKIITTWLEKKLDENQPREQAGFRSKYSTTDHIHATNQLKEKCRECNIPLCVAFVDYEKAFDSVQTQATLTSLQVQGIEDVYIENMKDIYTDSSVTAVRIYVVLGSVNSNHKHNPIHIYNPNPNPTLTIILTLTLNLP